MGRKFLKKGEGISKKPDKKNNHKKKLDHLLPFEKNI